MSKELENLYDELQQLRENGSDQEDIALLIEKIQLQKQREMEKKYGQTV